MSIGSPEEAAETGRPSAPARVAGTLLGVACIGVLGWADYLTGSQVWLSAFYVIPIVAGGWVLGRAPALSLAAFSSVARFVAETELLGESHSRIALFNATSRLVIFGALGVLTAVVRSDRRRLRTLLAQEAHNARTDALTGLANSRAFHDLLTTEVARAGRTGRSLCLAIIDLDNFKRVNDAMGHAAGDAVLVEVAASLKRCLRATDVPVRQGGDEFAVFFYETGLAQAEEIARRAVAEIARLAAAYPGTGLGASAGVALFRRAPADANEVMRSADALMYRAKTEGKGRVCSAAFD